VHTLKSNAGQLNKTMLQQAAGEVEANLTDGENRTTPRQMKALETELNAAVAELEPLACEPDLPIETTASPDTEAALELLNELEPMLKNGNAGCLLYIGRLREIPGSEALVKQMENLDFALAVKIFDELKKEFENAGDNER
jgi:HPt (histidine-containing phosphotransfer) domain-containing protein